jgi:hypothetical protein
MNEIRQAALYAVTDASRNDDRVTLLLYELALTIPLWRRGETGTSVTGLTDDGVSGQNCRSAIVGPQLEVLRGVAKRPVPARAITPRFWPSPNWGDRPNCNFSLQHWSKLMTVLLRKASQLEAHSLKNQTAGSHSYTSALGVFPPLLVLIKTMRPEHLPNEVRATKAGRINAASALSFRSRATSSEVQWEKPPD